MVSDRTATVEESALARRFRYAQANRLIRARLARRSDAIKGPNGWIQPEAVDFAAADRHFDRTDPSE